MADLIDEDDGIKKGRGRPKGSTTKIAKAAKLVTDYKKRMSGEIPADILQMTPLEVIMRAMHLYAQMGEVAHRKGDLPSAMHNWKSAAYMAERAAPYTHAKLSATVVHASINNKKASELSDDEIAALISEIKNKD